MHQRWRNHLTLMALVAGILAAGVVLRGSADVVDQVSLITAWQCGLLWVAVLLIGPLSVLKGRGPLVNDYRRRDLGIWVGITGLLHFFAAIEQSMSSAYMDAFITGDAAVSGAYPVFFVASTAGFFVGLLLLVPLALSNDWSLRRLGKERWKRWHRVSLAAALLTAIHALGLQWVESRNALLISLTAILCVALLAIRQRAKRRIRQDG